ncbi:MAG: M48 family metallopeptidase [Bacteroidota bacterium]
MTTRLYQSALYLICGLFLAVFSPGLSAQNSTDSLNYLEVKGPIPKEFTTPSTAKYKKQIEKLSTQKSSRKTKKDQKQFILQSNFIIDDLMQSGLVLFNDPVTEYLNEVLALLVQANPELKRRKPRAYALRSPEVNAFATDQGLIFVTLGLLANLENEAQLAYILAHELVHVNKRHTLNMYLETKDIEKNNRKQKKVLSESSFDRQLLAKNLHSKKIEMEADNYGLEYYLKTDYSKTSLPTVFDVLFYAYLPYNDVPFTKDFLVSGDYELPRHLWLKETKAISDFTSDNEDRYSTHPSADKRKRNLVEKIGDVEDKPAAKLYLVDEQKFKMVQRQARFELPTLYLEQENFGYAIYTAFLLSKERVDVRHKKVVAKSLYMMAKYKNSDDYAWTRLADDVEGASQVVFYLLDEMSGRELTVMALQYAWRLYQEIPQDKEMEAICKDLSLELADYEEDLSAFRNSRKPPAPIDTTSQELKQSIENSKLQNIQNAQKNVAEVKDSTKYWVYGFSGFLDNAAFKDLIAEGQEVYQKRQDRADYYDTDEGQRELAKRRKRERKKGMQLGIKKIAIVNPFYLSLDARKENTVQYVRSEEGQDNYRKMIKEVAEISELKTTILDVTQLSKNNADKFNDIRHLNSWFTQQIDHFDLSLTPGYNQNRIDEIAEKYKTDYFLWTGTISLRQKKNVWGLISLSIFVPYALPIAIGSAFVPEYDMLFYAILFDVKTGKRSIIKMDYFDSKDSNAVLRSHLYDAFLQVRKEQ